METTVEIVFRFEQWFYEIERNRHNRISCQKYPIMCNSAPCPIDELSA